MLFMLETVCSKNSYFLSSIRNYMMEKVGLEEMTIQRLLSECVLSTGLLTCLKVDFLFLQSIQLN